MKQAESSYIERAREILKEADIGPNSNTKVNRNGLELGLKEDEARDIAKIVLYTVYGRSKIRKQRPFRIHKVGDFWVMEGSFNKPGRGGVFRIVINSTNGCVEYLVHGK